MRNDEEFDPIPNVTLGPEMSGNPHFPFKPQSTFR